MKKVAIVMGSKSDAEALRPAVKTLESFGVEYTVRVLSAHRTPSAAAEFFASLAKDGYGTVICAAGKAAHLAGVAAGHTVLPVIGLPIKSSLMDGLDSLLSMVQMPSGVPVACVGVGAGENAALLAVQILAVGDPELCEKLARYKVNMAEKIFADDKAIADFYKN